MRAIVIALFVVACMRDEQPGERDAESAALLEQPVLSALAIRICSLKSAMRGNAAGWESHWRIAELANDALGLPPFAQNTLPGSSWHPVPTTLLGMGRYARTRASELVLNRKSAELAFLVRDERARYARGLAEIQGYVDEVERWSPRAFAGSTVPTPVVSCGTSTFRSRLAAGM